MLSTQISKTFDSSKSPFFSSTDLFVCFWFIFSNIYSFNSSAIGKEIFIWVSVFCILVKFDKVVLKKQLVLQI